MGLEEEAGSEVVGVMDSSFPLFLAYHLFVVEKILKLLLLIFHVLVFHVLVFLQMHEKNSNIWKKYGMR